MVQKVVGSNPINHPKFFRLSSGGNGRHIQLKGRRNGNTVVLMGTSPNEFESHLDNTLLSGTILILNNKVALGVTR